MKTIDPKNFRISLANYKSTIVAECRAHFQQFLEHKIEQEKFAAGSVLLEVKMMTLEEVLQDFNNLENYNWLTVYDMIQDKKNTLHKEVREAPDKDLARIVLINNVKQQVLSVMLTLVVDEMKGGE